MASCKFFKVLIVFLSVLVFQTVCFGANNEKPTFDGIGYVGTLPDLSRDYGKTDKKEKQVPIEALPSKNFNSANEVKPIPTDNPTFVNIILKKDKTTQYTNDLFEFLPQLESIYDIIEAGSDVQVFNAKIYFFTKNADYFRDKYAQKPEHHYTTYRQLMHLNTQAKSIAQLRAEAQKYNPYFAYSGRGYIYSKEVINEQLDYLKQEVKDTIVMIKESDKE